MTVANLNALTLVSWTGVETSFNANMVAQSVSHIVVRYRDAAGTLSTLTHGVHLTVSKAGASGETGAITAVPLAMPAAPGTVIFERVTPGTQATAFSDLSAYSQKTHEKLHDAAALRGGEARALGQRALVVPLGEGGMTLPLSAVRAGKLLGFGASGEISVQFTPGAYGGIVIDEDDMASNLSDVAPSQQSVKAFVEGRVQPVTKGGTGLIAVAQGDIIYASALNTMAALAKNASASRYLSNTGAGNNPAWAQVNLADGVTGNLPAANLGGGTNASAATFLRGDMQWVLAPGDVGTTEPYVIYATGQSNAFEKKTLASPWSPPPNLTVWNGTTASAGTAWAAPDNTKMNAMWSYAAQVARANPNRQVRLILIASNALAIANWLPGAPATDMYAAGKAAIEAALTNISMTKIDEFLWWQGESDAAAPSSYATNFESVKGRFILETWHPRTVPWVMFGMSPTAISGNPVYDAMSITLAGLAARFPLRRTFAAMESIPAALWEDTLHPTAEGYDMAGKLAYLAATRSWMRGGFVALNDDQAVAIVQPVSAGFVECSVIGASTGGASFEFASGSVVRPSTGTFATTGTSALAGTTGTDARVNYHMNGGFLYIENRLGQVRTIRVVWSGLEREGY